MSAFANCSVDWQVPTFLLVTGASRGLGATIALEFSKKLCEGSYVLLIARDKLKLEGLREVIEKTTRAYPVVEALDLTILDSPSYEHLFSKWSNKNFKQVILVNNAGSLGDVSKTILGCTSADDIKNYMNFNLHSVMFLTSGFINAFKSAERKLVINISSLAAVQPIKGWSLYCTGKAARDMYFRVLAEEEADTVVVLNYAPGPLYTDMLTQILEKAVPEIRQQFLDAQSQNQLLTCEYTVERLIGILERSRFKSGDHVDVFDVNY